MRKMRRALVLLFLLLFGCVTVPKKERSIDLYPIYTHKESLKAEKSETHILGPFYSSTYTKDISEVSLRPIFYWKEDRRKGITQSKFLYPLGKYEKKPEEKGLYLIPLIWYRKSFVSNRCYGGVFPIFWGCTEKGKKYGGFFPLYGTLRERFGKEKINFFLWPLFTYTKDSEGAKKYHILWPFFNICRGSIHGFKFFPIFGTEEKKGVYKKRFFLWPFVISEDTDLNLEPKSFRAFLPFYLRIKKNNSKYTSILFPFFSHYKKGNFSQWDILWPFFRFTTGKDYKSINFVPFYMKKRTKESESLTVLWPFYMYRFDWSKESPKKEYRIFVLSKYSKKGIGKKTVTELQIWPFYYKKKIGNFYSFSYSPYLIPIDTEGVYRIYNSLFKIYEHRRKKDVEDTKILWGLYKSHKEKDKKTTNIPLILNLKKDNKIFNLKLFLGVFEYESNENFRSLRFLYLPWKIKWRRYGKDKKSSN